MPTTKRQLKALSVINYDLFEHKPMGPPAPATLHTKIREAAAGQKDRQQRLVRQEVSAEGPLPSVGELYRRFDRFNWLYFDGKLPSVRIEYSNRMTSAGSYTPHTKTIKLGRRYHELFPRDIDDTLKHEMIHIIHFYHDAAFKREARRIGASLKARAHPSLKRPPRYIYACPGCKREFPRQKRMRMASCGYCSLAGRFDPRFKLKLVYSKARSVS